MLQNHEKPEAIREAVTAPVVAIFEKAKAGIEHDLQPIDPAVLHVELSRFIGLVGQYLSADGRDEWLKLASLELIDYPRSMLEEAIPRARKRVTSERQFVAAICEEVEPKLHKLLAEYDMIDSVLKIAEA